MQQTPPGIRATRTRRRLLLCVAAFTLAGTSSWVSAAKAPAAPSELRALQEAPVRQYRALRRMHASNEKFNQEGWLDCWTEFDERGFRYQIISERGSDYIREKVLRTLLKREQELISQGKADQADITAANYEFGELETSAATANGELYVALKPKRKDVLLVDGRMVLNQNGTELLRVEGRLAKNPSFWMNLVNVVREFARLDGVRVPISTQSVAKVKFAGISKMDVQYHYESINGRPVSLAARNVLASALTR